RGIPTTLVAGGSDARHRRQRRRRRGVRLGVRRLPLRRNVPDLTERTLPRTISVMRILQIATVCAVMIPSGIVYGLWTDRWSPSPEPRLAAARLAELPMTIDEWQGETLPVEDGPRGIVGCLVR